MRFDWRKYLELAHFLQDQKGTTYLPEAAFRSSVSRAYYAAYCYTRNYEKSHQGFCPSGSDKDHKGLCDHLKNRGELKIATNLRQLRIWRNQCDYQDVVKNFEFIVRSSIKKAEEIIQGFSE